MDKISIIVPVYNVEKYLSRCVNSLAEQTYENIEILLIDDGSKDNSGILCDELSKYDERIKVFHKQNGGLSDARNYGIERSKGDYICFVDSDDYVSSDYCEKMHDYALSKNADIVICKYARFDGEKYHGSLHNTDTYNVYSRIETLKNIYSYDGEIYTVAWNKLYKRSVIGNIRYKIGCINEDEFTTYKFFLNSNRIIVLNDILYFYFRNDNSITTNSKYFESTDIYEALGERKAIFKKNADMAELIKLTDKAYLDRIIFRNNKLKEMNKPKYNELLKRYRDYYKTVRSNVKGVGYVIYFFAPSLYYYLIKRKEMRWNH